MEEDVPEKILESTNSVRLDLLAEKSKIAYEKEYTLFCEWRDKEGVKGAGENILLAYFGKLSEEYSPSSLWPKYSMLRACLVLKECIDIKKYGTLIRFIKKRNVGYRAKKSRVLTKEQVDEFVCTAPDQVFLMMKVAFLIGIGGACRTNELVKMTTEDIDILENKIIITIPDSKNHKKRFFALVSEGNVNPVALIKKYVALRPSHVTHSRLFLSYRNGKCTVQPCGIHFFAKIPEKIATFLKLENPATYTGHCVRRSAATLLVNAGGDMLDLQELGGWKSTKVARGCLEENLTKKVRIAQKIQVGNVTILPSNSSTSNVESAKQGIDNMAIKIDGNGVAFNFKDCSNIQIHVSK